jgi:glucose-6-phosphate isomerase
MSNNSITALPEWHALQDHCEEIKDVSILSLFDAHENRFDNFHETLDGVLFDYSKHRASAKTMSLLFDLARARKVEDWRDRMFNGEHINNTEDRAVLHTALRGSVAKSLMVDGENVSHFVHDSLEQIKTISEKIRNDQTITDVVNIGVGGSDLGGRLVCDTLIDFSDGPNVHFLANIDGHKVARLLKRVEPESTVFIVSSKSFGTLETITNANTVRTWFVEAMGEDAITDHFYAISNNIKAAADFGIPENNILPLRDWVGGRYSIWSTIGLPIAISLGFDKFQEFLDGAHIVDQHFKEAPLEHNIPVIMALLGVWYNNFHGWHTYAVLPYTQNLQRLAAYIQQLDMESNGKSVTRNGETVDYATGPAVFGEPGTNSQHAFFQLLHQGTQIIPSDFIAVINAQHDLDQHHLNLLSNAVAQANAFVRGSTNPDEPHRHFEGSRPSSMFLLDTLDAKHLGMLLALYEHKVFVQGIIWNINSFDQWGVELGKKMAKPIMNALEEGHAPETLGSSTYSLTNTILEKFIKS